MGTSRVHTEDDLLAAPQVKVEKRSALQMGTKRPLKHPNKSQRYKRTEQSLNDARKTKGKKKEAAQAATKQHCASPWTWTSKQTPRHSTAREERHAHSLGETRGGSVAARTFFFKGKTRRTARWLSEPDWKWRMVFGNYATVSHTFALGAIVQQCIKLEGGAIVEWEQLSDKYEFSLHLDLFCHICWLGNKINVEKNISIIHPSSVSVKKSDTHPQTWKTADTGATNRPLWSTTETQAEHKGHCWHHTTPVSQATTEKPCVFSGHCVWNC